MSRLRVSRICRVAIELCLAGIWGFVLSRVNTSAPEATNLLPLRVPTLRWGNVRFAMAR